MWAFFGRRVKRVVVFAVALRGGLYEPGGCRLLHLAIALGDRYRGGALQRVSRSGLIVTALAVGAIAAPSAQAATGSADLATMIATAPSAQTTGYQYFHVTVTNNGPASASDVVITGGTPPRSTFYCVTGIGAACGSVPRGVTCTPPTSTAPLTCTTSSLSAGSSVSIWMGFSHGFFWPGQGYCDGASATSATPDPNSANNKATVCARVV
jgi:hypothetical protein